MNGDCDDEEVKNQNCLAKCVVKTARDSQVSNCVEFSTRSEFENFSITMD